MKSEMKIRNQIVIYLNLILVIHFNVLILKNINNQSKKGLIKSKNSNKINPIQKSS